MEDLRVGILELFAEAQGFAPRRVATEESGLEALRRAYRERHAAAGLCRSCPEPVVPDRTLCIRHLTSNRRTAARWNREHKDELNERRREKRRLSKVRTPTRT